jgi:hypothetical protein
MALTSDHAVLPESLTNESLRPPWTVRHLQTRWSVIGLILALGLFAAWAVAITGRTFESNQHFYRAYLVGYMFCLGLTLGSMGLLMLQHVTGGKWGLVLRRIFEASTRNFLLIVLMFIPVIIGMKYLFPWMGHFPYPFDVKAQEALKWREGYNNPTGFLFRAALYFVGWGIFIWLFNRWTLLQEVKAASFEEANALRIRFMRLGGGGLVFYALTVTGASVDWVMSLDPVWFSHIWGLLYMVGQALSALAFSIIILVILARDEPMRTLLRKTELHDNGKLLLAFVMLFTYLSFSQFIIQWSGNLVEEIPWYINRSHAGWRPMMLFLVLFHFAVPFLILLNRNLKKHGPRLAAVAAVLVLARLIDLYWHIMPNFRDMNYLMGGGLNIHTISWMDFVVPLAMASVWFAAFFYQLGKRPLLPLYHPQLPEALEHSHGTH